MRQHRRSSSPSPVHVALVVGIRSCFQRRRFFLLAATMLSSIHTHSRSLTTTTHAWSPLQIQIQRSLLARQTLLGRSHDTCSRFYSSTRNSRLPEKTKHTTTVDILTRTQVHRMRVAELRVAWEQRRMAVTVQQMQPTEQPTAHNMKRTQLVSLLLSALQEEEEEATGGSRRNGRTVGSSCRLTSTRSSSIVGKRNPRRKATDLKMMASSSDAAEEEKESLQVPETSSAAAAGEKEEKEMSSSCTSAADIESAARRPLESVEPQSILLRVKGLVQPSRGDTLPGTGIGWSIVYSNNNNTTATATTTGSLYFPTTRSIYEAEYTALILGLRHVLPHATTTSLEEQIPHVLRIQTDNDVVYHQMTHWYPVEKPSLQPLVQTVRELESTWEQEVTAHNSDEFAAAAAAVHYDFVSKTPDMQEVHAAALEALTQQHPNPSTLRDDDPMQSFWDSILPFEEEEVSVAPADGEDDFIQQKLSSTTTTSTAPKRQRQEAQPPPVGISTRQIANNGEDTGEIGGDTKAARPTKRTVDPFAFLDEIDYEENIAKPGEPVDEEENPSTAGTTPIDPSLTYVLQFDGGARGNSGGVAGCGAVVFDPTNAAEVWCGYRFLGDSGITNNQAEYEGILLGLTRARELGVTRIRCVGDSQLVIRQLLGEYKVKNARLQELHADATEVMKSFEQCELGHVARKDNYRADALANAAMDERMSHV